MGLEAKAERQGTGVGFSGGRAEAGVEGGWVEGISQVPCRRSQTWG